MNDLFMGYAKGEGKKSVQSMSQKNLLTLGAAERYDSYGGRLNDDYIDISFDTDELSQKFWDMADDNNWQCYIQENSSNGHLHTFWKIPKNWSFKDGKDKKLAVGLVADIHHKGTYIPIKVDGVERKFIYKPSEVDEVPFELFPCESNIDLLNLGEGDGRNDELFKHILVLKSKLGIDNDSIKRILNNVNNFIFDKPLSKDEIETITRDEAFPNDVFFEGRKFLFDNFANFLRNQEHVVRINGQLHIYQDGVYVPGKRVIEYQMIKHIPGLRDSARNEVMKYLEITCPNDIKPADARYIAFNNGVLELVYDSDKKEWVNVFREFDPGIIITNKIPWDYDPEAYSELADTTLNKLACGDEQIRSLLEECIGYCFYRRNEMSKTFVLTGGGSNGKSTFLDMVKNILGHKNFSALDLEELNERFSIATLGGVLANIGDDISDGFLQGTAISKFKKVVSGNHVKAEVKNDPNIYFMKPYAKILMSANNLPRFRAGGSDAILRRLVIIPFNAKFSKDDEDYDPFITYKLKEDDVMKYLILLGLKGLERVLLKNEFTTSDKVQKELEDFEASNNPIVLFLQENDPDEFENEPAKIIYSRYRTFCIENGFSEMTLQNFSKELKKKCSFETKRVRIDKKLTTIYVKT